MVYTLRNIFFCVFLGLFIFSGCQQKVESAKELPEKLSIKEIDIASLQKKIANNNGKLSVVNFWASWCIPCKEEMPALSKLRENYKEDINFFLVAIDEKDSIESVLTPVLRQAGIHFETYIKKEGKDEEFINAINKDWSGALPATCIYDKEGKLLEMLVSGQSYEKFEQTLKKYLLN